MSAERSEGMGGPLRWALETSADPAMAAADWLAREIEPGCIGAVDLVTAPGTKIEQLVQAKDAFKTMRVVGETAEDRRLGARLYAAAIAAALVRHDRRISRQSDSALARALTGLVEDVAVPEPLRRLAGVAFCRISNQDG